MRKIVVALLIVTCLTTSAYALPRLTVRKFDDKAGTGEASAITDMMVTELNKIEVFELIEREALDLVEDELDLVRSKRVDSGTAPEAGKLKGAQYSMTGAITFYYYDEEGGGGAYKKQYGGILAMATRNAVQKHVAAINEKFTGEQAVVMRIDGNEVMINRGSSLGVKEGDLYLVYSGYDDLAIIKVIDVRENFSHAVLVKDAGNIKVLRKSDTIKYVSKKEANSIIKRKKFAKSRKSAPVETKKTEVVVEKRPEEKKVAETKPAPVTVVPKKSESTPKPPEKKVVEKKTEEKKPVVVTTEPKKTASTPKSTPTGNAEELYKLAWGYEVHDRDYAKALEFYTKSAELGYAKAQYQVGYMYRFGVGVKIDHKKAVEWYLKAANQGDARAQCHLGSEYKFGKVNGLGKDDYAEAVKWYSKAAEQGDALAQYFLGQMYHEGKGVEKDLKKAVEWYKKAAAQGEENAKTALRHLRAKGIRISD